MSTAATLELTVQSTITEDLFRVVAEWIRPGMLPVRREREFRFEDSHKNPALLETFDSQGYGVVLGQAIFEGGIRDLFVQARGAAAELRVLLAIEAKRLQTVRWERLCGPFEDERWRFLATQQRTPFSLYLPSTTDRLFLPFGRPDLRALVVVASPQAGNSFKLDPFDEAQALGTALKGLGEIPSTVLAKVPGAHGPPTLNQICKLLTAERFTLLHVICHGALRSDGETAVFLDGEDGKAEAVLATRLIERLRELGSSRGLPHMAFLSVCDSAKPEAEGALGGLAQRLVRELGMPAVVAMTEKISQATALALGQAFYPRLRDHGETDRALGEACVEVRQRADVVVPALFSRLAGRPLFSDDLNRPLSPAEIAGAVAPLDALFNERAPVLRTAARALAAAVNVDPAALSDSAARERQGRLAELEQLCQDSLELSFSALARGKKPPPYNVTCPFPGLRAFTATQRKYFRGRDALVETLFGQLRQRYFMAVLGNSGSGKSSVVMAGVIPRLQDANPELKVAQFTPGEHPLGALNAALAELTGAADAVLYVDQFEETFTLCGDKQERKEFLDLLLTSAKARHKVVVSMRADFIGDCAEHKALREQVEGLKLVPPMTADELRNAVEEQAREAGLRYETGLCELILQDLKEEPGAMPLLQHALQELYERRHGRWLRIRAYDELGRVQKAITKTAESVWDKLDPTDQGRLRSVMLELTEVSEAEGGGPARYTRRRVPLGNLYFATPAEEPAIKRLINLLADERLLVKSHDDQAGDVVEVAHEALLRGWERLQEWLAASRDAIRLRQDMEASARRWRTHGKARVYLEHLHERGELVNSFLRAGTLKLDPILAEYFDACAAEQQRQLQEKQEQQERELAAAKQLVAEQARRARGLRVAASVLSVAFLGAVGAGVHAWRKEVEAEHSATMATAATQRAMDGFVELGRQAISEGRPQEALVYLTEAERGHEVTPLTRFLLARAAVELDTITLRGSFSADGAQVFMAEKNGMGKVWNLDNGKTLNLGAILPSESAMAAVSSDGKRLLTVNQKEGQAHLEDVASGKSIATLAYPKEEGQAVPLLTAAFSPDGLRIVTTGGIARVSSASAEEKTSYLFIKTTLWDGSTGALVTALAGHTAIVHAAFAPQGSRLVTVDEAGATRLWNGRSGAPGAKVPPREGRLLSVAFSPDGKQFLVAGSDGTARMFNSDNGAPGEAFHGSHLDEVVSAKFSGSGQRVVTASRDGTARIWDTHDGKVLRTLSGHAGPVHDAAFSPDEAVVVTGGQDATTRLWDTHTGTLRLRLRGSSTPIVAVAFSLDGSRILSRSQEGVVRVANALPAGAVCRMLGEHRGSVIAAAFSPDGTRIATASHNEPEHDSFGEPVHAAWRPRTDTNPLTAAWWDAATGALREPLIDKGSVFSIRFSPRGDRVVAGKQDGSATIWDTGSGRQLLTVDTIEAGQTQECSTMGASAHQDCTHEVRDVSFVLDGTQMETHSDTIKRWDAASGKAAAPPPPSPATSADSLAAKSGSHVLATSPDGAKMVTIAQAGAPAVQVQLRNAVSGELLATLGGHTQDVLVAAFSPDGTRLVTGSQDRTLRLWATDSGELLGVLAGHTEAVVFAVFSPDGRQVLSGSDDQTARLWDIHMEARPPAEIDRLVRCRIPLRLRSGKIVSAEPDPSLCPEAGGAAAAVAVATAAPALANPLSPPNATSAARTGTSAAQTHPSAAPAPTPAAAPVPHAPGKHDGSLTVELEGKPIGVLHSFRWLSQERPGHGSHKRDSKRPPALEISRLFGGHAEFFGWYSAALTSGDDKRSVSITLPAGAVRGSQRISLESCAPLNWTSSDLGSPPPALPIETLQLVCARFADTK